jgi:hypothetical protein
MKQRPDWSERGIPYINPDVRYLGSSALRKMNQAALEKLQYPIVLKKENGKELAVLVPWSMYLELQGKP